MKRAADVLNVSVPEVMNLEPQWREWALIAESAEIEAERRGDWHRKAD